MTEKTIYPRSTCCVAGCERWSRKYPGEWICGRHWRLIRASRRRALRKLWRMVSAEGWTNRTVVLESRLWRGARREATLRSAGI